MDQHDLPTEIGNSIFGGEPEIDMEAEAQLHGADASAVWGPPPMQVGPVEFASRAPQAAAGAMPPMQVGPTEFSTHRPAAPRHMGEMPMQVGPIEYARRGPVGQEATPASAGFGLLFAAAGAGVGFYFGKWVGAVGGLLSAGGIRNLYAAKEGVASSDAAARSSAMQRGFVGLVGLGAGAYLLYRSQKK